MNKIKLCNIPYKSKVIVTSPQKTLPVQLAGIFKKNNYNVVIYENSTVLNRIFYNTAVNNALPISHTKPKGIQQK